MPDPTASPSLDSLGYRQQLRRGMSAFGSFAISFSVISILTGAVSLYGYGLTYGGPIEMTLGWPFVALMTTLVALPLAELASAYPTAGALYHWASILGGPRLGYYAAWLNLVGQVAVVAGCDFALAELVGAAFALPHGAVLVVYGVILVMHGAINHVGLSWLSLFNNVSAVWHVLGTAVVVALLVLLAPHQPASFLLTASTQPVSGHVLPLGYACLIGLLQAQWTFTGYDASAHTAEEQIDAAVSAPRGMLQSILWSAIVGWALLLALTLTVKDVHAATEAANPFVFVVRAALAPPFATVVMVVVAVAMWCCGLASVTSNSRMLFALARDGGVPRSRWVATVGAAQTPHVAVWLCVGVAFLLALWGRAYSVIVAISTIGLYASYALPLVAAELRNWRATGPFKLRRPRLVRRLALVWCAIITVLFVLPPNERTGITFAGVLVLLVALDLGWAKKHFKGPPHA